MRGRVHRTHVRERTLRVRRAVEEDEQHAAAIPRMYELSRAVAGQTRHLHAMREAISNQHAISVQSGRQSACGSRAEASPDEGGNQSHSERNQEAIKRQSRGNPELIEQTRHRLLQMLQRDAIRQVANAQRVAVAVGPVVVARVRRTRSLLAGGAAVAAATAVAARSITT